MKLLVQQRRDIATPTREFLVRFLSTVTPSGLSCLHSLEENFSNLLLDKKLGKQRH